MGGVVDNAGESIGNGGMALNTDNLNDKVTEVVPTGNYILVGIDIDTTGRRLIDEIVQLAAYTPNEHFEQYIMPYMNLNPAARQRHQVRVISIGFYRMLKSMQTYKIIKSKSEIAALKDFLDWLEALKAKSANCDGLILVYHEERKFIPYMILESLKKYGLLDRFAITVKSFANGINLAKSNVNESLKHYSLRKLSKYLTKLAEENNNNNSNNNNNNNNINNNNSPTDKTGSQKLVNNNNNNAVTNVGGSAYDEHFDGNASVRAKLAYNVALQICNQSGKDSLETIEAQFNMYNALKKFANPIHCDLLELQTQNANLERQNSFRPVFLNYFKTTLYHRVRAVKFRIVLAENGFDLQGLNTIWKDKRTAGILEALQLIQSLKNDDKAELADLLDSYFDPNKTTIKPVIRANNSRRRNRRIRTGKNDGSGSARSVNTEYGAGGDKSQSVSSVPDSTTKSPLPLKSVNGNGYGNRGQRRRGARNTTSSNNLKTQSPVVASNQPSASVATPVAAAPASTTPQAPVAGTPAQVAPIVAST